MTLAAALIAEMSSEDLDQLAELLRPRLSQPAAPDAWLRGASEIAAHLACPRSRVYALVSAGRLPVERDGSALVARRSALDEWLRAGGARRP